MQARQRWARVCKSPTFRNDRDTGTFGPGFDGTSGPLRKLSAGVIVEPGVWSFPEEGVGPRHSTVECALLAKSGVPAPPSC